MPRPTALHHQSCILQVLREALDEAKISPKEIDAIAFTKGMHEKKIILFSIFLFGFVCTFFNHSLDIFNSRIITLHFTNYIGNFTTIFFKIYVWYHNIDFLTISVWYYVASLFNYFIRNLDNFLKIFNFM